MTIQQQIAIRDLTLGASLEDTATHVGVRPETMIVWLDDAAFQLEIERAESGIPPIRKPVQRARSSYGPVPRGRSRSAA